MPLETQLDENLWKRALSVKGMEKMLAINEHYLKVAKTLAEISKCNQLVRIEVSAGIPKDVWYPNEAEENIDANA